MQDLEMKNMLIEYMGKGFLDNILAMFRQDYSLCRFIPDLLAAENIQVRLGAAVLLEELASEAASDLKAALPGIIKLLQHESPTIRGDAASALGIIKDPGALPALRACLDDSHPGVREVVSDALAEIDGRNEKGRKNLQH